MIFEDIPNGIMNCISIIGAIASIFSIIVASAIPKAIMKYKIKVDMKENLDDINSDIKRTIERMKIENLTKQDFIILFDSADAMLFEYSEYMEYKFKIKSRNLHNEYIKMTEKYKDEDTLNKVETVRLLNRYSQALNLIKVSTGGVNDDKKSWFIKLSYWKNFK